MPDSNKYELFLKRAFGTGKTKISIDVIDEYGDPAGSAIESAFSQDNIDNVKAAVSYSISIFTNAISSHSKKYTSEDSDSVDNFFNRFMDRTFKATPLEDIEEIIDEFENQVITKYYGSCNHGSKLI